jgi:Na+-translocating ferredoxin:NAD+ oxidoreductase RNF subunit RnfB
MRVTKVKIEQEQCVKCNICDVACPVDAINGKVGYQHTINLDLCVGCKICIPVCPMDCIESYTEEITEQEKLKLGQNAKGSYLSKKKKIQQEKLLLTHDLRDRENIRRELGEIINDNN